MAFPGVASGQGHGAKNTTFQPAAEVLPSKILIVGTQLSTKSLPLTPVLSTSPADTGDKAGFGSMIHRLHLKAELGSQGIETWILPQDEAGGAAASAGEIDWAGSTGVLAGTLPVYISGDRYPVAITNAMTVEEISDAVVAAINAVNDAPVIAAKTAVTFETTFTAKSLSAEGDSIDISLSIQPGDVTPTGIASAITAMTGGSGIPTIATALAVLGTGDNANEAGFTELIHGYGQDSTTLDAILAYVGAGNDFVGLYQKLVARPFRSLTGDVVADSAGLAAQIVISDGRLDDRSQGVVSVPGSQSDPNEIAAQTLGHCARVNNIRAEEAYNNITLIGVQPGDTADRWTSDYDDRDIAVRAGISPTLVKNGVVKLQNVVSFYRPASVPVDSNGYREFANISKTRNILNFRKQVYGQEKWQNFTIVDDVKKVTNPTSRLKARDVNSVLDEEVSIANAIAARAWIASAEFTISKLKEAGSVAVRSGGDGFDITSKVVYSGVGNIINSVTEFDISFAVLNN